MEWTGRPGWTDWTDVWTGRMEQIRRTDWTGRIDWKDQLVLTAQGGQDMDRWTGRDGQDEMDWEVRQARLSTSVP